MRRLICVGCGVGEDLDDPTGDIHTVQLVDLHPLYTSNGSPDKPVEEDLCTKCRAKLRHQFFGETEPELLNMPLMKTA